MDVTLLELHFPEAKFNAPYAGAGGTESATATSSNEAGDETGGSTRLVPALVVLAVLLGLALIAKRRRPSDDQTLDNEEF